MPTDCLGCVRSPNKSTVGARGESGVLTCSALKRSYRDMIIGDRSEVTLVYLKGSHDLIHHRMVARHEHFMPVALLDSQFAALQEPTPDEHPLTVDVAGRPADIVSEIVSELEERENGSRGHESAVGATAASERSKGERQI